MAAVRSLGLLRSKAWVGGGWVSATSGSTFPVYNPSTGEKIADVADLSRDDTDSAIREAHRAQRPWAAMLAKVRSELAAVLLLTPGLVRPYLIDYMFQGFPSENCDPGGR